jgi:hypothetical protein
MRRLRLFLALIWSAATLSAESPAPAVPAAAAPPMNEFSGTVVSIDSDAQLLRMALEGGYNVEFTFNKKTLVIDGHDPVQISALGYGDKVTARYVGRELYAHQIVRTARAPGSEEPPAAAVAPEPAIVSTVPVSTRTP